MNYSQSFIISQNLLQLVKMNSSTFHDKKKLFSFLKHIHFVDNLQGLNWVLSNKNLVWIYKSSQHYMCSKMEWWWCFQKCPQCTKCFPFLHNFNFFKKMKKINETILDPILQTKPWTFLFTSFFD
jgi:hypothetical protein